MHDPCCGVERQRRASDHRELCSGLPKPMSAPGADHLWTPMLFDCISRTDIEVAMSQRPVACPFFEAIQGPVFRFFDS